MTVRPLLGGAANVAQNVSAIGATAELVATVAEAAKWADVDSLETFLGFDEVAYFVMFAWLAIAGPGPVSVDHLVLKEAGRDPSEHGA